MVRALVIAVLISWSLVVGIVIGEKTAAKPYEPVVPVVVEAHVPGFDQERFVAMVEGLRSGARTAYPVQITVAEFPNASWWGRTWLDGEAGLYRIELKASMPWVSMVDTLVHEWAHAVAWQPSMSTHQPHGPYWGVAFSESYSAALAADQAFRRRRAAQQLQEAAEAAARRFLVPLLLPWGPALAMEVEQAP